MNYKHTLKSSKADKNLLVGNIAKVNEKIWTKLIFS